MQNEAGRGKPVEEKERKAVEKKKENRAGRSEKVKSVDLTVLS